MTVVVFSGPTLPVDETRALLDADVRPPAARGDVLAAALGGAAAIGIIDGYFAHRPAVWHKEILWAMSQGIPVFGAASMGALRASELCAYGMEGVGVVFDLFRTGELADDDEVAVAHAPAEQRFRALSDAMVNIRATVAAAVRAGVISEATRGTLVRLAKDAPYPDRTFAALQASAEAALGATAELAAFRGWLPHGRVDQKREDALAMLRLMRDRAHGGWPRKSVSYTFARTDAWEALHAEVTRQLRDRSVAQDGAAGVLEELAISGRAPETFAAALGRALGVEQARRMGVRADARATDAVAEEFRRERSLLQPTELDAWLQRQRLSDVEAAEYFQREALVRSVAAAVEPELALHVVDHLRAHDTFAELQARAETKQRVLRARGLESADQPDTGLPEADLWRWYFSTRLGHAVPGDLQAYARTQRLDLPSLRAAVAREYLAAQLDTAEPARPGPAPSDRD